MAERIKLEQRWESSGTDFPRWRLGPSGHEHQAASGPVAERQARGMGDLAVQLPALDSSVTALPAPTCPGWLHTEIDPEGQDMGSPLPYPAWGPA